MSLRAPLASLAPPAGVGERSSPDARRVAGEGRPAGKALVLGDDTRGFLATVRSLGRQGIEVHAAPFDFRSPALASRYVKAIHDIPPWMDDGSAWRAAIRGLLAEQRFDLVIPCDERNLLPLQLHRAEFEATTKLAIPGDRAVEALFDKHATRELAARVGVPIAQGRLARPDDEARAVLQEFGGVVVVKPRRSFTLEGLARRGRVAVVSEPAQLAPLLADAEPNSLLLEACFEGSGLGLSILAHEGRLLQAFEHHRVHERSGSSFYRVSAPPNPALVEACAAVAAGVDFTGIAMFEFKQNESGDWILLEVNARPWGSLPLPVALGVDFPYRWYRLLVDGVATPPTPYRVGVYGRNLLPDLVGAFADAEARRLGPVRTAAFIGSRLLELRRALIGNEKQDVFVADDPGPARAQVAAIWREAKARAHRVAPAVGRLARITALARVRDAARRRPVEVTFVCQGNICRSPYAAALLAAWARGRTDVRVSSAGMMPRPGRPVPDLFQRTAAREGMDLGAHRSAWLDREAAQAASLIVVFDEINFLAVGDRYPEVAPRLVKLGDLIGVGDIADPVDGDAAFASATYAVIRRGVERMQRLLA